MALVEFRNVYFTYNLRDYVLEGVDIRVPDYGITCVSSDPGKGKTTFLKLIKGLLLPTRGSVVVLGIDTSRAEKSRMMYLHTKVSIHFQDTFLISNIDVYSNIALPLLYNTNLSSKEIEYEIDKTLELFDLKGLKYEMPFNLSPTETKLISISRTFLRNPRIILLDEPFSLLDSFYRVRLLEIMEEYRTVSKIILTTSDEGIARRFDSIVYIFAEENEKRVCLVEGR